MDGKEQPKKWPNTVAFQDEYTREFMASTKEVKEGYYLFKSKTGGYTMWFPKDAKIDRAFYEKHGNYFEALHFGGGRDNESISYYIRTTYEKREITEDVDLNVSLLSDEIHYNGDYEKMALGDKKIYFGSSKQHISPNDSIYYFFGYVKSNESHQAIQFIYSVTCKEAKGDCDIHLEKEEDRAKMLMKSIKFQD
ncbi:hypothetical protein [Geobacillus icigianus]|uniref:Lipoprotein YvcA n=1 Tax=Geobacillus icigianus TaxID=1430331 RepID=A0ABU6BGL6_9BACL|nr:hypothetical protein [Geobacillus icigianus]MEB3751130.1 putative lipoprotein YvcA [Geobacillus icigianus]